MKQITYLCLFAIAWTFGCTNTASVSSKNTNWDAYLGDKKTSQYSPLSQINTENVDQLKVLWTYHTGDGDPQNRTQIQCNPLVIDGVLYGSSPRLKYFAIDATTGENIWTFDPFAAAGYEQFGMGVNRGLAYWTNGTEKRLLVTADSYLYCLNAATGQPIPSFGENGKADLKQGLDRDITGKFIVANTPGIIYDDLLILGARVSESTGHVPGHIRAFNVKTGEQAWLFHTIPHPGEFGYDTWPPEAYLKNGGANAWAGMALDEQRGVVYVPTGSASFDFYGGDRKGDNLFANCILALDARTGERKWHYQTVHHDVWDRDHPAPPTLVTVEMKGKKVDAVAQATKSGYVFLLDRDTGKPLHPVKEVPVPASKLDGEHTAATQPVPTAPPPFARTVLTENDLADRTPEIKAASLATWQNSLTGHEFNPPSEEGTIIFPDFDGGAEWGGQAFDEASGLYFVNSNETPSIIRMVPYVDNPNATLAEVGQNIYNTYCLSCHGADLKGASVYTVPDLNDLHKRYDAPAFAKFVKNGKGAMPSFGYLKPGQVEALAAFLLKIKTPATHKVEVKKDWPYPYYMDGYNRFTASDGYPAIKPPYGQLTAIDLGAGTIAWQVPLGSYAEIQQPDAPPTGTRNYGGPVVTAGDLLFIAATADKKIRAFNKNNGDLLWEHDLPEAGFATPAVYAVDGKQYVVIACGGGKLGLPSGDAYVAFGL